MYVLVGLPTVIPGRDDTKFCKRFNSLNTLEDNIQYRQWFQEENLNVQEQKTILHLLLWKNVCIFNVPSLMCRSRLLSLTGHRVFVRHALSSLATHIALVLPLPKAVSRSMESLMRNFLWSAGHTYQKRNQIKWSAVCLPTREGGLGIRRVQEKNAASFTKLAWTVASSNSLWANWKSIRYVKGSAIWSPISPKSGSCIWHIIRSSAHLIHQGSRWKIGDGRSVDIWFDNWAMDQPLASLFNQFSFPAYHYLSSIWNGSNWEIPAGIPTAAASLLSNAVHSISIEARLVDQLVWKSNPGKGLSFKNQ